LVTEPIYQEMSNSRAFTDTLEDEAIYILREALGQFTNPVILFSGGKDSISLVHLAAKAFWPGPVPFSLLHIDTGHNFEETLRFRDVMVQKHNLKLHIRYVKDSIRLKGLKEEVGPYASRNRLQTHTLLDAISELKIDACIGGARRDEERSRAKERFFSFRNRKGQWDIKNQRAELFDLFNGKIHPGENIRIFPLSNWTEMDVWQYIQKEAIEVPSLYFSHTRDVFMRDGLLWPAHAVVYKQEDEQVFQQTVRFRTIGDMTCTAAFASTASTVQEVINELYISRLSERGSRIDDKRTEAAMEKRKTEGYF
jgi:sulfate adenylyltransferase subunit 2